MYLVKINSVFGNLSIISTDKGISRVMLTDACNEFEQGDPFGASRQIREYLAGTRRQFELPVDIKGTEFQMKVWQAAAEIAYGKTATYGELAKSTGNPKAARAVGAALGKNPVPIIIPCHRVIGSAGLTGYALGLDMKKMLLDMEKANLC